MVLNLIDSKRVMAITGKLKATNNKLIEELERLEIIKEITGAQRNKLYIFTDYLNLFK